MGFRGDKIFFRKSKRRNRPGVNKGFRGDKIQENRLVIFASAIFMLAIGISILYSAYSILIEFFKKEGMLAYEVSWKIIPLIFLNVAICIYANNTEKLRILSKLLSVILIAISIFSIMRWGYTLAEFTSTEQIIYKVALWHLLLVPACFFIFMDTYLAGAGER